MKKIIAILCVAMLLIVAAVPAMAEQGKGGGQPAGMNDARGNDRDGRDGGNKQTPPTKPEGDTSGQKAAQPGNAPANNTSDGSSSESGNAPANSTADGSSSESGNEPGGSKDPLQKLVEDGKLSQSTYDAVRNYLKENASSGSGDSGTAPEKPEGEPSSDQSGQNPPEKPEGEPSSDQSGKNPPEKPEGNPAEGGPHQSSPLPSKENLDAMLSAGLITEDEYNTLLEAIEKPASSSDSTESASSEETSTDETTV